MRGPPLRDRRPSSKRRFELGGASGERPDSFSDDLSVDPSFSTGLAALLPARFLIASSSWAISATVESDALEATPPGRGLALVAAPRLQPDSRRAIARERGGPHAILVCTKLFILSIPKLPGFPLSAAVGSKMSGPSQPPQYFCLTRIGRAVNRQARTTVVWKVGSELHSSV